MGYKPIGRNYSFCCPPLILILLVSKKPKIKSGDNFNSYTAFRKPANEVSGVSHGGVAVLVRNSISHRHISIVASLQAVAVRVTCGKVLTICFLYLPPFAKWSINDIADLLEQLPFLELLLGDFNAHNPLWGSNKLDSKGKIIEDILLKFNLSHLNFGSLRCRDLNSCSAQMYFHTATGSTSA